MHIPSASPFSSPAMNSTDVVVGLLTHAVRLLEEHQGRLTNADRTVLSSAGSMLDHLREQVQQRLSSSTSKSTRRTKSSSAKPKRTSAKSRSRSK